MAWNEPGGGNRDPWGNRGGGNGGPPDLDEAVRKLKNRIMGLFGGRGPRRPSGNGSGGGDGGGGIDERLVWGVLVLVLIGWLASGFYIVQPPERAVVTRFGAYQETLGPGPHWHLPWPIESAQVVNVARNRSMALESQIMLTSDENLVRIDLSVQYDVRSPEDFLFKVRSPEETLFQVVESVLREVVGKNSMDFIITEGRGAVAQRTHDMSQGIIDGYESGVNIQAVNLQRAQPPEPVQPAFEDVNKAREDRERFINEAEAVRNDIVPTARGNAAQAVEQARAYRTRVTEEAEGDASRFLALLEEYQQAPAVTRKRLYLDTMQTVLGNTGKVLISSEGDGRNLIYLPLDRMQSGAGKSDGGSSGSRESSLPRSITGGAASGGDSARGNRPTRSRESN